MILVPQVGYGFAFAQDVFLPRIQLLPEIRRLPLIHEGLVVTGFVVDIDKYIHKASLRCPWRGLCGLSSSTIAQQLKTSSVGLAAVALCIH
jgi:hypothetical protein